MNTAIIIGLIGTFATILFGALSIYIIKRKRYPGEIIFIQEDCLSLVDAIVRNFEDISIQYKNRDIGEDILYLKGLFLNSGDIDVNENMIEQPLTIRIPDKFKWLNIKITKASSYQNKGLTLQDDQNVAVKFGLFRKKEFIQFEGLIETSLQNDKVSSSKYLLENISFSHRISDVRKVTTKEMATEADLKKLKGKRNRSFIPAAAILFYVILFASLTYFTNSATIRYSPINSNKTYSAEVKKNGRVILNQIDGKEEIEITFQELTDQRFYRPILSDNMFSKNFLITIGSFGLLILIFSGVIIIIALIELRQANKLNSIIRIENGN